MLINIIYLMSLTRLWGPSQLPAAVRAQLTAEHPGWTFAQLDTFNTAGLAPGDRPDWVSGDFDTDGTADYAVQIVDRRLAVDSQQMVIAFLARPSGYRTYQIQAGLVTDQDYLRVNRRGADGFNPETSASFRYDRDTLSILLDQTAGWDCPFQNDRFVCHVSGD